MQNAWHTAIGLTFLFFFAAMIPMVSALNEPNELKHISPKEYFDGPVMNHPTQLLFKEPHYKTTTGGRAACVAQSDAGTPGDAGGDANTSRSLGTNPNSGQTGVQGCMDTADTEDWYEVTITAGKDVDVELTVPSTADFDLYLVDSAGTEVDASLSISALEKVSTSGTSLSSTAGTFYIRILAYSGDGQYSLRTWTNNTPPRPDLTITSVLEPAIGQPGGNVNVEYVVKNIYNTTSDAFEIQFILSTDQIYDFGDELIDVSQAEAALAENTSRNTTAQVSLPSNLANGTYYWMLYVDGYDNVTEHNESNNLLWSTGVMLIGDSCDDLHPNGQNDAGLGSDAPADEANVSSSMGTNVTATYTGCIDGIDENDVLAFDVPVNHSIDVTLTLDQAATTFVDLTHGNLNYVDSSVSFAGNDGAVSSLGTSYDGIAGTYYVNLSRSGTGVNWTLDVWTNYSAPAPNLVIENITAPLTTNAGNSITVDVEVNNTGTLLAPASLLTAWLSVDGGLADHDVEIGNMSIAALDINETDIFQLMVTVPANAQGGNYSIIAMVDSDEQITEKNEMDNTDVSFNLLHVDSKATSCPVQDDAASGGDVGEDMATSYYLGIDVSMTINGCVHKDVDDEDWFEIEVSPGLNLTVTLVNSPDQDADIFLRDDQGDWFDRPWMSGSVDETVTTVDDANFAGTGGTFYVSVDGWASLGVYTLIIETEGVDPNSFNCGQQNDLGLGQDAPTGNGINVGQNPTLMGEGCFSGFDESDVYSFTVNDGKNFEIDFTADPTLPFTATLQDTSGNLIASVDNTSYGPVFTSYDSEYEGMSKDYVLTIDSNNGAGFYNLSVESLDSAPADVGISSLACPTNHTSGSEVQITWELVSLRGNANATTITLHLDLIDSSGEEVARMITKTVVVSGEYNTTFGSGVESYTTVDERASGIYNCRLTIDADEELMESDESNNQQTGTPFFIQNEEELWANDVDRDGFNTTDSGDGLIDDCPTTFGDSTIDRTGCADLDGDGVSNLNDLWPFDPSQSLDTDGDSYGDNSSGIDGDACPEVFGVPNGVGGDGCPAADTDADDDGVDDVNDQCPDTPAETIVGPDGCETVDEQPNPDENTTLDDNLTLNDNVTDEGNDETTGAEGGKNDADGAQSSSDFFGMAPMTLVIIIGAGVVLLLSLVLIVRGRSESSEDKLFEQQQMAYASIAGVPLAAADPTLTAEQLAYEQQLVTAGYPADYARAYADQHFRPWLKV
ncbi:MAG: CARDB domain-containing protein [Candidatus Poseidoniales archaeon]